jgi:pimeloyl-ACP methyl ester carboxylesterase
MAAFRMRIISSIAAAQKAPQVRLLKLRRAFIAVFVFLVTVFYGKAIAENATSRWWSDATEHALAEAGTNRLEWMKALEETPAAQHDEIQFLIENAPLADLQSLSAGFLLKNILLADASFQSAPWKNLIPREIFLNEILSYACVNETRDDWRPMLHKICAPLVSHCQNPGEAACRLNETIFKIVKVRYSTDRQNACQSPAESMRNGLASCTGLSILLVDACRAVGIPARLVGTPMWADLTGNHSWVEVWDSGWHFVGAAEPDSHGLDCAWFQQKASRAVADVPLHAIYAASFKKTSIAFPLDWAPYVHWVNAVNVTARYASKTVAASPNKIQLLVKIIAAGNDHRIAAKVTVDNITNSVVHFEGISKGETADLNNVLTFELPVDGVYQVCAALGSQTTEQIFIPGTNAQQQVDLSLGEFNPLAPRDEARLKTALAEFFTAPREKKSRWKFERRLEELLLKNDPAVRLAAWETFKSAPIHDAFKQNFDAKQVHFENYSSPYTVKYVGVHPTNGWALFIAMHGGGGAAKAVNDEQWGEMQHYYKDHPDAGGYIYLALRAPNDTWNGFYDVYVYPLIANLVHQFLLFGDVNPDKVFIMGYSHGGYGAFAIGPKEPDLFAAIHASAAAPTDGETTVVTLRNTIFTCMVGGVDVMYGRRSRDEMFRAEISWLRGDRTDIYPDTVNIVERNGHTGLPDRDLIKDMYPAVRNPVPRELTWLMTDSVVTDFFWLHTDAPGKQKQIAATCRDNQITVTTTNVTEATVLLDSRLVDFQKPVMLECNGKISMQKIMPSLRTLCETLQRRCDPGLAYTAKVVLPIKPEAK